MRNEEKPLAAAGGTYAPTFFKMFVDTPANLDDIGNLDDYNTALFLHEYIHFIQDVSTTYGLLNMCMNVNFLREASLQIKNTESNEFYIPIRPTEEDTYQVFHNLKLRHTYLGNQEQIALSHYVQIEDVLVDVRVVVNTAKKNEANVIKIKFTDGLSYELGSYALMENMAYIIERLLYPDIIPNPPTLPYTDAELLVNFIYPEFGANILNTLALIDAALLVFHPGDFFYKVLVDMKKEDFIPTHPRKIYDYIDKIEFDYEGADTINSLIEIMSLRAGDMLASLLHDPTFYPTTIWVKDILAQALDLRLKNRGFILDIIEGGLLKYNKSFIEIFVKIGTPLIINSFSSVWFHPPLITQEKVNYDDLMPAMFWAIYQVRSLLIGGKSGCEMIAYCQSSAKESGIDDYTDDNCYSLPWKRLEEGKDCSYCNIWHMWNLSGKKPMIRS